MTKTLGENLNQKKVSTLFFHPADLIQLFLLQRKRKRRVSRKRKRKKKSNLHLLTDSKHHRVWKRLRAWPVLSPLLRAALKLPTSWNYVRAVQFRKRWTLVRAAFTRSFPKSRHQFGGLWAAKGDTMSAPSRVRLYLFLVTNEGQRSVSCFALNGIGD